VSNFVDDLLKRLNYEKDIDADERKFTHDLAYMREFLKNFLSQSASTFIIFTQQFKTLSIKNHERIVIRSFEKIINLSASVRRIREVSQTLKKLSTADEKSQWWFQNVIISCQKNIYLCKNIESRFTIVAETWKDINLCKNIESRFTIVAEIKKDVCFCKNIESTSITIIEIKRDICLCKNIMLMFIIIAETEKNIIQIRWKCRRANSLTEESKCLIMSQNKNLTMYHFADESKCLIMSQSRVSTMCRSVKKSKCLIMSQNRESTMCHSVEKNECLIMSQSRVSIMHHSAEKSEFLIMNQNKDSTMHRSVEEMKKALFMKEKVNASKNCFIAIQNDSDETNDAILKSMKIHKCFNSLIWNDVLTSSFINFASYFFESLTQLICKQQKMNHLIITIWELMKKKNSSTHNIKIDFSIFMINWSKKITDDIMIFQEFIYVFA